MHVPCTRRYCKWTVSVTNWRCLQRSTWPVSCSLTRQAWKEHTSNGKWGTQHKKIRSTPLCSLTHKHLQITYNVTIYSTVDCTLFWHKAHCNSIVPPISVQSLTGESPKEISVTRPNTFVLHKWKGKHGFGRFLHRGSSSFICVNELKGKWSSGQRVKTVPGCFSLFVIHLKTHYISSLMWKLFTSNSTHFLINLIETCFKNRRWSTTRPTTHPETVTEKCLAPSSTFCNNFIIQKCLCIKGLNAARGTALYACGYYELAHYRPV